MMAQLLMILVILTKGKSMWDAPTFFKKIDECALPGNTGAVLKNLIHDGNWKTARICSRGVYDALIGYSSKKFLERFKEVREHIKEWDEF
jgi:hypothetical protein